jgi:SAM-dependent methyltransferase
MHAAWDRASARYLAIRGDADTLSYGNLAPGEDELALLGNLQGKRILDFGCGGGHNAIACALAGARVVGMDFSTTQLAAATELAAAYSVSVDWQQGDENALGALAQHESPFDLILAVQVLPYVDKPGQMLRASRQLLIPGGQLVVSFDHPFRNLFYDEEAAELGGFPVRRYDESSLLQWSFGDDLPMHSYHRPLGEWVALILAAGFHLNQLLEVCAPAELCDDLWPEDSPLAPLRLIPHTAILVAVRPEQSTIHTERGS